MARYQRADPNHPSHRARGVGAVPERRSLSGPLHAVGAASRPENSVLLILKTAGAAGAAWVGVGLLTGSPRPVLAALAAVLVVQATVYQTVRTGVLRVVGVVLGVLLALGMGRWLGLNAWSLTVVLLVSLAVGRLFRLGNQTSQVAVSALLVLAVGDTASGYAHDRVVETLLGAAVGVCMNVLVAPPLHVHAARDSLATLAKHVAGLTMQIGNQLSGDTRLVFAAAPTRELLWHARGLHNNIAEIQNELDRAAESLRYNLRRSLSVSVGPKPAPTALLWRLRAATEAFGHIVDQITGIARTIVDVGEGRAGQWDPDTTARVGALVAVVGRAVDTWANVLAIDDPDSAPRPGEDSPRQKLINIVEEARSRLATIAGDVTCSLGRENQTPGSWLTLGSVLADLSRILAEIDPVGGGHSLAVAPTPAAHLHLFRPSLRRLWRVVSAMQQRLGRLRQPNRGAGTPSGPTG